MGECHLFGSVDSESRAILEIQLRHPMTGAISAMEVWVDTGFTGDIAVSRALVENLQLPRGSTVRAVLADGSPIQVDTHSCFLHWFGEWKAIEVIAADCRLPLLGVGLLQGHDLHISYRARTLSVD